VKQLYSRLLRIYLHLLSLQDGEPVIFKTVSDICPDCGKSMESKSSDGRQMVTLIGRVTKIVEKYYVCPRCKDAKTSRRVIHHSEPLRSILPQNTKYGYDAEIEAGYLQYMDNKQMDEIQAIFAQEYGISVSRSQIHELGVRFLEHMVVIHYYCAPSLKKLFESGCVYHVDATCEAGRGMELSVKEGWSGITLGVWKIPTENEEAIKRHLRSVVELFGEPAAFVSDLGNGMMSAIASVILEMNLNSRQLVCHTHFLNAIGKSILEDTFKALKSQLRKLKVLANLNRFVKETGNIIKPQATAMREYVARWLKDGPASPVPGHLESVAVLRALAQWVILFGAECKGQGFPFALSHVHLFDRCAEALNSILRLLGKDCLHERALKYAKRLQRILQDCAENLEMRNTVQDLKAMDAVFTELRDILRLEKTDVYKQAKDKKVPDELEVIAGLKEEVLHFRGCLSERLDTDCAQPAQTHAIRAVIAYLDQYQRYLFDHFFVTYDASGSIVIKLIERTNNIMERSYRHQKHQIRRRTGAKNLGFIFERLFPAAGMISNLDNPIYCSAILGDKKRGELIDLISSLGDRMDYRDTPMFQDDSDVVGGRLPKADKTIVSKSVFTEVVLMLSDEFTMSHLPVHG